MSSPIAIPRSRASPASSSRSPSGSPTGVYVPVHKRRAVDPHVSIAAHAGSAVSAAMNNGRLIRTQSSFVYDIAQLRALAASPLIGVSPAQQSQLEELRAFVAPGPRPANPNPNLTPSTGEKAVRRRRAGRRASNAKKLQAEVHVDVESRRRRHGHGAWGWAAHSGAEPALEESWRHAPEPMALVGVRV
ncbi:uncharacterized protein C8Q71DRAFT_723964 [Rhodofomes roseus]|uniref:Uncharacterized protein n=1 Tax=Rhodofomes roseus TaxID=34475 RepID=A0ABQ8KFT5_9APHY|nr:uncharacterized protein C8Q71DRAFT_723964 [Rhodofomes roseus]KAH9836102.1 hypothetical protein C8Q71DRAFT_723964 [Rhodofomes roseus]